VLLEERHAVRSRVDQAPDGGVGWLRVALEESPPVHGQFFLAEALMELRRLRRSIPGPDEGGGVLAAGGESPVVAAEEEIDDVASMPGQFTAFGARGDLPDFDRLATSSGQGHKSVVVGERQGA